MFLGASVLEITVILRGPKALPITSQVLAIAAAVVWGYAARMKKGVPLLNEFRRSDYAVIWDELSLSKDGAAIAAAGQHEPEALRSDGKEVASRIAFQVELSDNVDVLEIGSGVGRVGWALAPMCRSWTGCDISRNMLKYAADALGCFSNVHFVQLSGDGLKEIESESFDVVYATNMLAHLSELDRWIYVKEAHRVLRPGGTLYIDTIALDSPEGWAMMQNNLLQRQSGAEPPYAPVPSTREEFLAYFNDAEFADTKASLEGSLLMLTGRKAVTSTTRRTLASRLSG
jgi:SAM-dependent methyltransferase